MLRRLRRVPSHAPRYARLIMLLYGPPQLCREGLGGCHGDAYTPHDLRKQHITLTDVVMHARVHHRQSGLDEFLDWM